MSEKQATMIDITDRVSALSGVSKEQVRQLTHLVFDAIEQLLIERGRVSVKGFGSWTIKIRPKGKYKKYICRLGEDPEVEMPDRTIGFARMSGLLAKRINTIAQERGEAYDRLFGLWQKEYDKEVSEQARKAALRVQWKENDRQRDLEAKRLMLAEYGVILDDKEPF